MQCKSVSVRVPSSSGSIGRPLRPCGLAPRPLVFPNNWAAAPDGVKGSRAGSWVTRASSDAIPSTSGADSTAAVDAAAVPGVTEPSAGQQIWLGGGERAGHGDGGTMEPPSGGGGGDGAGGGSGGGGGGGDSGDDTVLSYDEVIKFMDEKKLKLPADILAVAQKHGLRLSVLTTYIAVKDKFFLGWLVTTVPFFRDRILADPLFFFKVAVELAIDSACTTIAEVRKRGEAFWGEFELYLSDLFVGLTMDIVLVSLMAPVVVLGGASKAAMASGFMKLLAKVPSAVFAASPAGGKYSVGSRLSCLLVKFGEYSLAGMFCGLVGQGIANYAMESSRAKAAAAGTPVSENAVAVPPLIRTALVWGLFMGVSSNLRYQAIFGVERLVDITLAKNVPQLAYVTTVVVRFLNNVFGGENFIDLARWAGVQPEH